MLQPIISELSSMRIILASGSPRRKNVLSKIGLKFEVVPSRFEENLDKSSFNSANDYAKETALKKAEEVAERLQGVKIDAWMKYFLKHTRAWIRKTVITPLFVIVLLTSNVVSFLGLTETNTLAPKCFRLWLQQLAPCVAWKQGSNQNPEKGGVKICDNLKNKGV